MPDVDAMKAARDRVQSKQSNRRGWLKIPVGETQIYVADSPYKEDDLNFVECQVHNKIGPDNKMLVCLDPEKNPIVQDPRIQKFLKEAGKDISGGCRVCKAQDDGEDLSKEQIGKSKFLWNLVPLKFRKKSGDPWGPAEDAESLLPLMCGTQIWEGIVDVYANNGDISNPDEAILIRLVRKGTGMTTKYTVSADTDSIRKGGIRLPKPVKAGIRMDLQPEGPADLYKLVAGMIKPSNEVAALYEGVELEDDSKEEDEKKPACYALDFDADDPDCKECDHLEECGKESGTPLKASEAVEDDGQGDDSQEGDNSQEGEAEGSSEGSDELEEVLVTACEADQWYCEDEGDGEFGPPMKFERITTRGRGGKPKGVFFTQDGDKVLMTGGDTVIACEAPDGEEEAAPEPEPEPTPPPKPKTKPKAKTKAKANADDPLKDDPEMADLDKAIENRKKKAKAKKKI